MYKKIAILGLVIYLQFQIQYFAFVATVKKDFNVARECLRNEENHQVSIKRELEMLKFELSKINSIQSFMRIKSKCEDKNYLILSALKYAHLIVTNIIPSSGSMFNVRAIGDFSNCIDLLNECNRTKNLIITYFFVERFDQKKNLSLFVSAMAI